MGGIPKPKYSYSEVLELFSQYYTRFGEFPQTSTSNRWNKKTSVRLKETYKEFPSPSMVRTTHGNLSQLCKAVLEKLGLPSESFNIRSKPVYTPEVIHALLLEYRIREGRFPPTNRTASAKSLEQGKLPSWTTIYAVVSDVAGLLQAVEEEASLIVPSSSAKSRVNRSIRQKLYSTEDSVLAAVRDYRLEHGEYPQRCLKGFGKRWEWSALTRSRTGDNFPSYPVIQRRFKSLTKLFEKIEATVPPNNPLKQPLTQDGNRSFHQGRIEYRSIKRNTDRVKFVRALALYRTVHGNFPSCNPNKGWTVSSLQKIEVLKMDFKFPSPYSIARCCGSYTNAKFEALKLLEAEANDQEVA